MNDLAATGDASTYTVVATGWDSGNSQVLFGEATTKSTGSCQITFRSAGTTPDLYATTVTWTWAIYGAKHKA